MLNIQPDLTVLITTKNRSEELRRALNSVVGQDTACHVLVFDDGSTDDTSDMVRREFPTVRLERVEEPLGIIAARNTGVRLCTTPLVMTIDDDCVLSSPATIRQTLACFDHPRVAAVAIPYYNPAQTPSGPHRKAQSDICVVSEFAGGANALKRNLFLQLGGYRADLWRQTEEYDFCTRLLAAGYVVRLGNVDAIQHCESLIRDVRSIMLYTVRNHIIYAWRNVPGWRMAAHILASTYKTVRAARRRGCVVPAMTGIIRGISFLVRNPRRAPVSQRTYRLMRRLRRQGGMPLRSALAELAGEHPSISVSDARFETPANASAPRTSV
jgi:GT2 family glycosyltransferase